MKNTQQKDRLKIIVKVGGVTNRRNCSAHRTTTVTRHVLLCCRLFKAL